MQQIESTGVSTQVPWLPPASETFHDPLLKKLLMQHKPNLMVAGDFYPRYAEQVRKLSVINDPDTLRAIEGLTSQLSALAQKSTIKDDPKEQAQYDHVLNELIAKVKNAFVGVDKVHQEAFKNNVEQAYKSAENHVALIADITKKIENIEKASTMKTVFDIKRAVNLLGEGMSAYGEAMRAQVNMLAERAKNAVAALYAQAANLALLLAQTEAAAATTAANIASAKKPLKTLVDAPNQAKVAARNASEIATVINSLTPIPFASDIAKKSIEEVALEEAKAKQEEKRSTEELKKNVYLAAVIAEEHKILSDRLTQLKVEAAKVASASDKEKAWADIKAKSAAIEHAFNESEKRLQELNNYGYPVESKAFEELKAGARDIRIIKAQVQKEDGKASMEQEIAQEAKRSDEAINEQLSLLAGIKTSDKVTGLRNCGNVCYMNAAFQALFHTSEFNRFLQVPFDKLPFAAGIDKGKSLLKIVHKVFADYLKAPTNTAISTEPLAKARKEFFLDAFGEPKFMAGQMEDAQEFLTDFLDQLRFELNVNKPLAHMTISPSLRENFDFISNYELAGGGAFQYSLINRWFGGYYRNVLIKTDHSKTLNFEHFLMVNFDFPPGDGAVTLNQMYENFVSEEKLIDSPGNLAKKITIQRAPQNLIVQLKRFGKDMAGAVTEKITRKVDYPLTWPLNTELDKKIYELYATVLHSGGTSGGHYTAKIKAGNAWYDANDSVITPITEASALNNQEEVYLLFYRLK